MSSVYLWQISGLRGLKDNTPFAFTSLTGGASPQDGEEEGAGGAGEEEE